LTLIFRCSRADPPSSDGKKEQQAGLGNPSDINGGNRKTNEPCGYRTAKNNHRVTDLHWLTA
jgi:hypothetical protein